MLRSLGWFLGAFGATLGVLALLRYRLSVYEQRIDLKNTLQEISQEVALGYFQHCYNKLCELPTSRGYKSEVAILKAQCLLGLGRKQELHEFLIRTLEHQPKNHTARRMLAKLLADAGQAEAAIEQFRLLEGKLHEEDLLAHATALYRTEDWTGCQRLIEEQCKQPNGQLLGLLADALFQQRQWALATDYYQKAENLGWRPLGLIAHKAQCLNALGRLEEAEPCLREWLRASPRDAQAASYLASCLERRGKAKEALQLLEYFQQELCDDALSNTTQGRCYFRLQDYPRASHYLLNAYELGHEDPSSLALAAMSLEKQQLWSHAEQLYQELIAQHPNSFAGYAGLAYLFALGHSQQQADQSGLSHALRAVELQPCVASWELLSAAYARCGMFEKAHQIQQHLMRYAKDHSTLSRRQEAMRQLRQHKTLNAHLIPRIDVA